MISKPMLAGTLKDIADVKYPVLCTPKLDGIRALKVNGKLVSRNFKPIPNKYVRSCIEEYFPDGVDGELIVEDSTFQATTSAVMRESGEPSVVYYVFDYVTTEFGLLDTYKNRCVNLVTLHSKGIPFNLYNLILPVMIRDEKELLEFEKKCLADGHEGVMLRTPEGPYKCGRSTVREGYLLKLKRFSDDEATILGVEERMHNTNEAKKDKFGRTERSSHKANMVPTNMLGAFRVQSKKFKNEFSIGTGLTEAQRIDLWKNKDTLIGKLIKFKYQASGVKDVPRFPVFLGFRDEGDL